MLSDGTNKIKRKGILSMLKDQNESGKKYLKRIVLKGPVENLGFTTTGYVDIYAVIDAFGVACPALAHAIKKLLCPGERGDKDKLQDIRESKDAVIRAFDMERARIDIEADAEKERGTK